MATEKNIIKNWFITGAKPTQEQFWLWQDSYWHKNENLSIDNIEGLGSLIGQKADASQLEYFANKDASNIEVNTWKTKLGVGDLPSNIATVDEGEKTGNVYLKDQTYKKVQNPGDGKTYLLNIDGKAIAVDGLGESIYSSDGTTKEDRTLIQGKNFTWNTGGNPLFFKGLPNKDIDVKYNRFKVQDENGQEAYTNGISQFTNNIANATDAQKDAWRKAQLKSDEKYSTGQPSISVIMPPLIDKSKKYSQPITFIGSNLFVDNVTPTAFVELIRVKDIDGNEVENTEIDVSSKVTVLQELPNILSVIDNFNDEKYETGYYKARVIHNGLVSASSFEVLLTDNIKPIPTPNLEVVSNLDPENVTINGNTYIFPLNNIESGIAVKNLGKVSDYPNGVMFHFGINNLKSNFFYYNKSGTITLGIDNLLSDATATPSFKLGIYFYLTSTDKLIPTVNINGKINIIEPSTDFYIILKDGLYTFLFPTYNFIASGTYSMLDEIGLYIGKNKSGTGYVGGEVTYYETFKF